MEVNEIDDNKIGYDGTTALVKSIKENRILSEVFMTGKDKEADSRIVWF